MGKNNSRRDHQTGPGWAVLISIIVLTAMLPAFNTGSAPPVEQALTSA